MTSLSIPMLSFSRTTRVAGFQPFLPIQAHAEDHQSTFNEPAKVTILDA